MIDTVVAWLNSPLGDGLAAAAALVILGMLVHSYRRRPFNPWWFVAFGGWLLFLLSRLALLARQLSLA